ncbi:MAG: hypothetical protein ACI4F2_00680 [Acutalibacteraceae bacterium]
MLYSVLFLQSIAVTTSIPERSRPFPTRSVYNTKQSELESLRQPAAATSL